MKPTNSGKSKSKGTFRTFRTGEFKKGDDLTKLPPPRKLVFITKDGKRHDAKFLRRVFVPIGKDGKPLQRHPDSISMQDKWAAQFKKNESKES